jgi:tetratricopeptide (TPR) repeat protein
VALTVQGRYPEAEEALRRALEQRPGFAEAYNNLALCLMYQKRYEEAEPEVFAALERDPSLRDARLTLSSLYQETGRPAKAVEVLEGLRAEYPSEPELGARLGVALEAAGRHPEALPLLRAGVEAFPQNFLVLAAAARAEESAGDPATASRLYAGLAQRAPRGPLRDEAKAGIERLALAGKGR